MRGASPAWAVACTVFHTPSCWAPRNPPRDLATTRTTRPGDVHPLPLHGRMSCPGGGCMGGVHFAIGGWAAMASGLHASADWHRWAKAPWRPEGALAPTLAAMPAMQRRRLSLLGRAAAEVAWDCHPSAGSVPVVFASAYGDAGRCLQLLKEFASVGDASPTEFTFSVHNAIGAMYSIARGDTSNYTSVAAGPATAASGVVEACALLADGAREVLLVAYDEPLPDAYKVFQAEAACAYAWAWRIVPPQGGADLSLTWTAASPGEERAASELPAGLEALRFAISRDPGFEHTDGRLRWTWSRHA